MPGVKRIPERLNVESLRVPDKMTGYDGDKINCKIIRNELFLFFLNTYFYKSVFTVPPLQDSFYNSGILEWIENNTYGYWYYEFSMGDEFHVYNFWFENSEDATHFNLTWC